MRSFVTLLAAVTLLWAMPLGACDACVYGDDGKAYCLSDSLARPEWPRVSDCSGATMCYRMPGGGRYCEPI